MSRLTTTLVSGLLVAAVSAGLGFFAGNGPKGAAIVDEPQVIAADAASVDKGEVEAIVRAYLLKNPEIMLEVQTALETKRDAQSRLAQSNFIKNSGPAIFSSAEDAIIGNPKGDVTVVEFFDYNCGYCRRAIPDMQALVKTDPNVRFVLKELPILGPDSVKAHNVAQAFKKLMPEKYGEFHLQLLGGEHADEDTAIAVAVSLGADEAKLKTAMQDPEIAKHFQANESVAAGLSITGTPSYVIQDEVVPGALGLEVLAQKVSNVRKCQKATC